MEFKLENLEVQMSASSCQTPNQQICITNEDVVVASEVSIERSDVVEVDKTLVIQKKFIVNEKYMIPKASAAFAMNQSMLENQASCIDLSLVSCEAGFQDSQGSGKMEIASQESLESKMEISSQGSLMEYSSQETDVAIELVDDGSITNTGTLKSAKSISTAESEENGTIDVFPTEDNSQELPTYEKPAFLKKDIPNHDLLKIEGDVSKINSPEYKNYEAAQENKIGPVSAGEYCKRQLTIKKCLVSREEAVAAREAACMSREKAIEEREAALANKIIDPGKVVVVDDDVPSPKRLKLISVFEYN